jgi:hypothetical protein
VLEISIDLDANAKITDFANMSLPEILESNKENHPVCDCPLEIRKTCATVWSAHYAVGILSVEVAGVE